MFGYVLMNKPEIKFKDYDIYRSFYCGLCRELREKYGIAGQISISYDMTFVLLLLSGLYEPPTRTGTTRCAVHPVKRQPVRKNEITEYAAAMNLLLTYYKCIDDWEDERKVFRLAYARILEMAGVKKNSQKAFEYREKSEKIVQGLHRLSGLEKDKETDIDKMAGCFGHILEEVFAYRKDVWEPTLRRMGFYLGKFIYLLDAYDDVEEDKKKGNYNPFAALSHEENFAEQVRSLLILMLAEACREFEKLPIIKYGDILRNILYSGVWCRFEAVTRKRKEIQEKKHD